MFIFIAIGVGLGAIAYQAGLFDRPEFKFFESLIAGEGGSGDDSPCLYTILALSTEKHIGKHFERLSFGVLKGMKEAMPDTHQQHLLDAVTLYNKGNQSTTLTTTMISAGLYFDDPNVTDKPRWGVGMSVGGGLSYDEWMKLLPTIQEKSDLAEPIRLVRVGGKGTTILKGNIPYHNMLTPMLAPLIFWNRAYKVVADGKYPKTINGRIDETLPNCGGPALELYHCSGSPTSSSNEKCSYQMHKMEYIVLMNDVTQTWNDAYPLTVEEK